MENKEKSDERLLKASFSFKKFVVLESQFQFNSGSPNDLDISIKPYGSFNKKTKLFELTLEMWLGDEGKEDPDIYIKTQSSFLFEDNFSGDQIPKYFTVNAPAITFPYIRSYISALTALSGRSTITLATLNLVRMASDLEANIEVLD